jgi:hypothetical protein
VGCGNGNIYRLTFQAEDLVEVSQVTYVWRLLIDPRLTILLLAG